MNDQIKELAEKAGFDVNRLLEPHPGGFPREDFLALKNFAELIVNECALVARWHVLEHNGMSRYYTGDVLVEDAIRNNFKEQL